MKKRNLILLLIPFLMFAGCSATQPMASKAMDDGLVQQDKVFQNTADKLAQMIVNHGAILAEQAIKNMDTNGAEAAIEYVFVEMKELSWLQIQWERGRTLMRTPQEYIWSQRPFWQIMWDEWNTAKEEVDKNPK